MRKLLLLLLVFTSGIYAQQGFNYKAVIYDNNNPVQNQSIDVRFTIYENVNTAVYQETQNTTTDSNGIIILSLGEGTVINGSFATVSWNSDTFLKVEIDKGAGFQDMGTTQFNYVPLAKYADKAGNTFSGYFDDLNNIPSGLSDGDDDTHLTETQVDNYVANNGYLTSETDGSTTNELQTISKIGSTVTLSNGGGSFTDTDTHLTEMQVDNYVANNGYLTSETDGDTTNELQNLSVSGNQLTISNGNTVTLPTGSGGDQWGSQVVDTDLTLVGEGISSNPLGVNTNAAAFSAWDKNASDDFDGEFTSLNNIPSGLLDGDDDTHLTETQVDNYVANNGYLTTEVDGSTTNELQTITKVGNTVTLSNGGGSFTDTDTNTQLTETQVDNYVANNGYLTTEVDGSTTNELQTLSISGDQLTITDGNTITLPSSSGGSDMDFLVVGTGTASNNNSDNIYHEGNISIGHDGASNAKLHINNIDSDIDDYENTGIFIYNNNTSTTNKIGVKLEMEAPSTNNTAIIYGVKKNILDNGDSDIYGEHTSIGGLNGDGDHYGSYYFLNSDGNGVHTGAKALVLNGMSEQIGFEASVGTTTNANTEKQTGIKTHIYGQGTGDKYGVTNLIDGDADGNLYGVENTISNTSDYPHYGTINRMSGSGSGNHFSTSNIITGDGSGKQYGVRNYNSNTGNNTHFGMYSKFNGAGSGEHIGINNLLQGNGTGAQFGILNQISNTGDAVHYGVKNELSGDGAGAHYGNHTTITGNGSGAHYGNYTTVSGSGNGLVRGALYEISNTGSGTHVGVEANLTGSGIYSQVGFQTTIDNSGNNYHYGVVSKVEGNGSGQHTGVSSKLGGTGTGTQYGYKATVNNSGSGDHYGNYISMSNGTGKQYGNRMLINGNNSTSTNYGNYISMYGDGTGGRFGEKILITTHNNSPHYGNYVEVTGDGVGRRYGYYAYVSNGSGMDKYGVYAEIDENGVAGSQYAIYGRAIRTGATSYRTYAGFFEGDVKVTKKLKAPTSGNADMKAYIYGTVSDGNNQIVTSASSNGFTVTDGTDGYADIHFNTNLGSGDNYIVMVTLNELGRIWVTNKTGVGFQVRTKNNLGSFEDIRFDFVVYKK